MTDHNTTLPRLLIENAEKYGSKTALREKEWGIWQTYSWQDYLDITAEFASGLRKLGLGRKDVIVLIGDNRPEWLWAEIAIQSLGGIALGVYQDVQASEIEYIFELTGCRLVIAEDQEQVDKMLSMREKVSHLEHIIFHDSRGLSQYKDSGLMHFDKVREMGRPEKDQFAGWVDELSAEDTCLIATTSGTTGRPKLAMLSHKNLLSMAHNLGQVDSRKESDEFVSFLPLAWMGEQMMAVASSLLYGFCVNFPEEQETVQNDIREIGPHIIFSPPRVWENLSARIQVRVMETTRLKRFIYHKCMGIGIRMADCKLSRKPSGVMLRLLYSLSQFFLFRSLRDRLGFSRIRSATTGGAALGPDTFKFFHAMGVNLKQIYGQTEIAGISCIHRDGHIDFDTVGEPIPETELKLSPEGEILSKSAAVFQGYYKDEKATKETLSDDGWLLSGDAGYFKENGQLVVIDRVKDVMELMDGTKFSPQFMENKLKFSPYIREAVVMGKGKDYIAAIVCIDEEITGRWSESKLLTYTTYQDLSSKEQVYELIAGEIHKINETLPDNTKIRRFALLFKELDADDGELTRTRKIRRKVVAERYAPLIDGLYTSDNHVDMVASIQYQDGSTREMKGRISIRDVG
ncbi:MAG: long-chain fatty acid--CoA ligase [Desulfonatronovibrio sp. MSAO_Bac4]|nr:MAG: long-chain fatty acid--CoA ligase [Desulfonatronovibrio sp. MSAO_Bac4]